ncbi:hypothetical protein FE810_06240 [Thalassotalea litorea]|uniref:DUF3718 domain-containing protein n=1 Tax=Thalassotalea litorea TaxID=2020715 RepID=A0A5R9ISY4_9GAMM|nr:hypothetical protein [Thalassotalea litorea]TLU66296.1 hypothetical protein FE810_06240 [Thalassotalea litorea]
MYKIILAAGLTASFAVNATATNEHLVTGNMAPEARLATLYDVKIHTVKSETQQCWISATRDGQTVTTARVEPSNSAFKRDALKACVKRDEMFELIQQAK